MTITQLFKRSDQYAVSIILIPIASAGSIYWLYDKGWITLDLPIVFLIGTIIALMVLLWHKGTKLFKDFLVDTPYPGIVYSVYSHVNLKVVPRYLKTDKIIDNLHHPGYGTEKFLTDNNLIPVVHKKYSAKLNLIYGLIMLASIWVPIFVADRYELDHWIYYGGAGFILSIVLIRLHEKNYNKRRAAKNNPELKFTKDGMYYKDELIGWENIDSWSAPVTFESKHPGKVFIYYTNTADDLYTTERIELNIDKMQASKYKVLALLAHYKYKYSNVK